MTFFLHILFLALATLAIILGVGTAVFFRRKSNWLKIHKILNSFGLFGMIAGVAMAVIYIFSEGGKHINGIHQLTGVAALVLTTFTLLVGFYQFKAKNKAAVRTTHRLMGRCSLVMILTAIMLGLKLINIF